MRPAPLRVREVVRRTESAIAALRRLSHQPSESGSQTFQRIGARGRESNPKDPVWISGFSAVHRQIPQNAIQTEPSFDASTLRSGEISIRT